MSLTNYGERTALSLLKRASGLYLAFFTAAPSESDNGTEVSGGSYARQAISFSDPATDDDGTTSMSNAAGIEFPTASSAWGTVVSWGIFDARTSGNLLWYGTLTTQKTLTANDTILVHAGDLILRID